MNDWSKQFSNESLTLLYNLKKIFREQTSIVEQRPDPIVYFAEICKITEIEILFPLLNSLNVHDQVQGHGTAQHGALLPTLFYSRAHIVQILRNYIKDKHNWSNRSWVRDPIFEKYTKRGIHKLADLEKEILAGVTKVSDKDEQYSRYQKRYGKISRADTYILMKHNGELQIVHQPADYIKNPYCPQDPINSPWI